MQYERAILAGLLGGHSVLDPPDPIPNSEVKRHSADDSVGFPHVKVGHRQALNVKTPQTLGWRGFFVFKYRENIASRGIFNKTNQTGGS